MESVSNNSSLINIDVAGLPELKSLLADVPDCLAQAMKETNLDSVRGQKWVVDKLKRPKRLARRNFEAPSLDSSGGKPPFSVESAEYPDQSGAVESVMQNIDRAIARVFGQEGDL